ncbi:MAG: MATE family efflux transporter [Lachnospiraceae bacterium]|nr:MATE family efflux transporter [Lachnospiraceae bacterium]
MQQEWETQYDKMTRMPVSKLVLQLGIPTTLSMLVTNLYNLADTYFVSQLGTSASAAVGVIFPLMSILQAFGFMLGHGAGSNISRQLGAKKTKRASVFASTSFFLALITGTLILALGLAFLEPLMRLLKSTETILPYSTVYGGYILVAAPAMVTSCVLNNILRYEGRATLAMIGLVSGSLLNILGDALFLVVLKTGIWGAGFATAFSQYISAGILLSMFLSKKTQSELRVRLFSWKGKVIWNIISVGVPSFARQGLNSVSVTVLNGVAAVYGDAAIAAMSIVSRFCNFLFAVGLGIGQGFQPVCGFNYGAGKYSRVRKAFFFTLGLGTAILGIFAIMGLLFSGHIVELFRDDPEVIRIGTPALRYQCIALFLIPVSVCGNMLFQSVGKSGQALFLSCLRSGVCFLPLLLLFSALFKLTGIQLAQPAADVLSSVLTVPFVLHFMRQLQVAKEGGTLS